MRASTVKFAVFGLFLLALPLAPACDCSGTTMVGHPTRCTSSADCHAGQTCVDGTCHGETDGSVGDGSHVDLGGATCIDTDHDGYGLGCAAGADCDDTDPHRGGAEVCDGYDNNCDGTVDEGFDICFSMCNPTCAVHDEPGAAGWMPTTMNSDGVVVDPSGALTLGRVMAMSFAVWVANMDDGTVSKMDSRTNVEIARYPTTRPDATNMARPWNEACNWSNLGNCPSRTSVNQNFDAYVANRAFGNQGTVTKYANREADCIDRNGNGVIDTSRDVNGDGSISTVPADGEFIGPEDECLLWTVPVGANDGWPRALAIGVAPLDADVGDVWVGLFQGRQACRLDPATGATMMCIDIMGFQPYGAAADEMGRIWMVDRSGARPDVLGYVDAPGTAFHIVSTPPAPGGCTPVPYGVTTDGTMHVYFANSGACDPGIYRYEPTTDSWITANIPGGGTPRGVAADEHSLWTALSHDGTGFTGGLSSRIVQYNITDLSYVATHTIPTGNGPVGVGVSFDGSVWAICQGTNSAARLDPATSTWIEHPVGLHPYTYSDFIGFGLNTFAQPRGHYTFGDQGCPTGTDGTTTWTGVAVHADTPPLTHVEIWVRTADDPAMFGAMTPAWIGPFPFTGGPIDLSMAPGPIPQQRYIQVDIRLSTDDRHTAPRVFSVDVAGTCTPIIH